MLLRSVKNWLTLLMVALVAIAMLAAYLYVVPPLGARLEQQKLVDARGNANLISDTVKEWIGYEKSTGQLIVLQPRALDLTIASIGARLNGTAMVLTRSLVPRAPTGQTTPDAVDYPMLPKAVSTGTVQQGVVTVQGQRYAATAVPLSAQYANEKPFVVGVVLVTAPLKDVDAAVRAVQRQLLQAALLALGLSLLLGYMASYFIAGRLKRIERSAEAIAGGDLSTNVPASLQDEIGQLAQTFNTMAERLRDAFAQVEYERDRVEVLLNDLSEGVVGISADGRVTIANPAAAELLGRPIAVDASVDTALPEDIAAMWHESRREDAGLEVVFENDDKTLEGTTYAVGGNVDFTSIVVLRDVSAQARLERARRDFIANASHEFKTPLFSLGGSLELLDEGDLSPEEQREFLQVMRVQVERLRNLAVSMLDLSRVEAGSVPIEFEMVPLEDVALSVVDEFQVQIQDRSLTMTVSGDDGSAWCDEQRLAQVLRALLDNAVKYTPRDGAVSIVAGGDEEWARIVVSDDGPGIAEVELPHVFERFHRGREERATTSGAGLGLSIAREITELMRGSITAATGPAGGATFTVTLRRRPLRRGSPDGGPAPVPAAHEVHDS